MKLALICFSLLLAWLSTAEARSIHGNGGGGAGAFNGGGIQINRAAGTYYTGMDRWLNWWSQGATINVNVTRQVTIAGSTPTVTFLHASGVQAGVSLSQAAPAIQFQNGGGTLPSCITAGNTYYGIATGLGTATTIQLSTTINNGVPGSAITGCTGGSGTVTASFTTTGRPAWNAVSDSNTSYFNATTGELNIPVPVEVTSYGRGIFTSPAYIGTGVNTPNTLYGPPNVGSNGPQGKWWLGLVLNIEWTGTISTAATKIFNGGVFGNGGTPGFGTIGGCGTNCVTGTLGNTPGISNEVGNLAIFFPIDASNRSDPPRLTKAYPASMAAQAHSGNLATSLINPDWLAQWGVAGKSGVGVVRWMEENGEININGMTDFSQLAEYTYNSFAQNASFFADAAQTYAAGTNLDYGPKGGIGPQTVCVIQNRLGAHAHYNIPWGANSTYGSQLATSFDGCMNQGLLVKYEFCNEDWNFGGAFQCFEYLNSRPWPPLGASAPYQQAVSITSITPGVTTTINGTNTYTSGQYVAFSINTSDTIAATLNQPRIFQISSATGSSFVINEDTTGKTYSSGGTVFTAGSSVIRGGYDSARQMQQIYTAYGTSKRSRWKGVLGGQMVAAASSSQSAINGAMFYITNESSGSGPCSPKLCLTDLYDELMVAPYSGNSSLNGLAIASVGIGATPTVTMANAGQNCANEGYPCLTNGSKVRFYAKSGMTQLDNVTATVSGLSGGTFTINVNTSSFSGTPWVQAGGNFVLDNDGLPQAIDDSIAKNIALPGTYPTKYSYFAEQMTDAILNGTSQSNPAFKYTVANGFTYKSLASCPVNPVTGCLPAFFIDNATLANSYGLVLNEYEAAPAATYYDTDGGGNIQSGGPSSNQVWDFFSNWVYDAGTAVHQPGEISQAHIDAGKAAGVSYPSLFNESSPGGGPFNFTRYFGDTPTQLTGPMYAKNAAGPYTLPRPAPTWTANYAGNTTNYLFTNSGCNSCVDSFTPTLTTGTSTVFVLFGTASGGPDYPVIRCDTQGGGSPIILTRLADSNINTGLTAIYVGTLASNASATRTCTATYSTTNYNFQFRSYYAFTATGLQSLTPTYSAGVSIQGATFTAASDSLVVMVDTRPGSLGTMTGRTTPDPNNPTTLLACTGCQDFNNPNISGFSLFRPTFASPLMSINGSNGATGAMSIAVFH